jgi:hypothetical protein
VTVDIIAVAVRCEHAEHTARCEQPAMVRDEHTNTQHHTHARTHARTHLLVMMLFNMVCAS